MLVNFEQRLQSRNRLVHFTVYSKCTTHTGIQTIFLNLYKIAQEIWSAKDTEGILTAFKNWLYVNAFHYVQWFQTTFKCWRFFILVYTFYFVLQNYCMPKQHLSSAWSAATINEITLRIQLFGPLESKISFSLWAWRKRSMSFLDRGKIRCRTTWGRLRLCSSLLLSLCVFVVCR